MRNIGRGLIYPLKISAVAFVPLPRAVGQWVQNDSALFSPDPPFPVPHEKPFIAIVSETSLCLGQISSGNGNLLACVRKNIQPQTGLF